MKFEQDKFEYQLLKVTPETIEERKDYPVVTPVHEVKSVEDMTDKEVEQDYEVMPVLERHDAVAPLYANLHSMMENCIWDKDKDKNDVSLESAIMRAKREVLKCRRKYTLDLDNRVQ